MQKRFYLGLVLFCVIVTAYILMDVLQISFLSDDYAVSPVFVFQIKDLFKVLNSVHMGLMSMHPFRPVAFVSFYLDYRIFGFDSVGFHLTNIIIHSVNTVFLFYFLRRLSKDILSSFMASLFFGLYPANVEPVAWVVGRYDSLAAFWLLVSLLLFSGVQKGGAKSNVYIFLSSVAFLFSLFSKEVALSAIFIFIPLTVILKNGDGATNRKWLLSQLAALILFLAVRFWMFGNVAGDTFSTRQGLSERMDIVTLLHYLWRDFRIILTPFNRQSNNFNVATFLWISAPLLTAAVYNSLRDKSVKLYYLLILGVVWIIGFLLPSLALEDIREDLGNARFLYLPSMGLAMIMCLALVNKAKFVRYPVLAIFVVLLAINVVALRNNIGVYHEASEIAKFNRIVVNEVIECNHKLNENTQLVIVNMPVLYKGAHLSPTLFASYFRFLTGIRMRSTLYIFKEPWDIAEWYEKLMENHPDYLVFVFDPETNELTPM
jgi:hypothetical protein